MNDFTNLIKNGSLKDCKNAYKVFGGVVSGRVIGSSLDGAAKLFFSAVKAELNTSLNPRFKDVWESKVNAIN